MALLGHGRRFPLGNHSIVGGFWFPILDFFGLFACFHPYVLHPAKHPEAIGIQG
jgi:hypothetical protein